MVSAVSASSWRFRDAGRVHEPCNLLAPPQVECDESGAFGEWFKRVQYVCQDEVMVWRPSRATPSKTSKIRGLPTYP